MQEYFYSKAQQTCSAEKQCTVTAGDTGCFGAAASSSGRDGAYKSLLQAEG